MIITTQALYYLLAKAVLTIAQLINVSSTKAKSEVTLYDELFGIYLYLDTIQILGYTIYVH